MARTAPTLPAVTSRPGLVPGPVVVGSLVTALRVRRLRTATGACPLPLPPPPRLVLVAGRSGTGKSTLGRLLAPLLSAAVIDMDTVAAPFVGLRDLVADRSPYDAAVRLAQDDAVRALAQDNLAAGVSAVVVAPFLHDVADPGWRRGWEDLAAQHGAVLHLVWVTCPADQHRARMAERARPADLTWLGSWERFLTDGGAGLVPASSYAEVVNDADPGSLAEKARRLALELV